MNDLLMNNGVSLPPIGYGTYKNPDTEAGERAVCEAITAGYRLIDTASAYSNERSVGRAIRESSFPRHEIQVTTKVNNPDRGYDSTLRAFEKSMKALDLGYVDLYLIHWPVAPHQFDDWERLNRETWRAMERLVDQGVVKTIGVSNFLPSHLNPLLASANICPAVNQIEFHPGYMQRECLDYCNSRGIVVEGWSPLGRQRLAENPLLNRLAGKYHKSVSQICLRWSLQHKVVPLPKSMSEIRIKENIDIFGFHISDEDMAEIDAMAPAGYSGLHPDSIDF